MEPFMEKVERALKSRGKLFVHTFAHKKSPCHFKKGWMNKHFFTGGKMP
jgi:cyclopropane fatty-acyl-phospholipid synthase-like methyltransferase